MTARSAVPAELAQERPTEPQMKFIRGLAQERDLSKLSAEQHQWLTSELAKSTDDQFIGVTVRRASDIITVLKALPVTPKVVEKLNYDLPDVPAGRYAVENDEGELRFYRLWIGRTGYKKLYVLHGPDSTELPYKTALSILGKIFTRDVLRGKYLDTQCDAP